MRVPIGLMVALGPLLWGVAASAGEDEVIVAAEPGYAAIDPEGEAYRSGIGFGASAWLGTPSSFWLAGSVGTTGHFDIDDPVTFEALAGIVYAFDVFAAIPFAEAQGGLITGRGGVQPTARFGLGIDYLVTRTVAVGLVGRVRPLADPLGNALMTAHIRVSVRLEY